MSQANQGCECCKALWIEFRLCEDLSYVAEKACARIVKHWQGELPISGHCSDNDCQSKCEDVPTSQLPTVCVFNQPASTQSTPFLFFGEKGDQGIACYDDIQDRYRIVQLGTTERVLTGVLTEALMQGASALVDEVGLDSNNELVYTGRSFTVWDLKLNAGQSIEEGVKIDFSPMSGGRYKWIAAHCQISDTLPEEV